MADTTFTSPADLDVRDRPRTLEHDQRLPATGRAVHLHYLEGIRGWAALFVAVHHAWWLVVTRSDLGPIPRWFMPFTVFKYGEYMVTIFIVLSGYCLMLPVARSADWRLAGGLRQFAIRRARRILIPYYTALGLAMSLIVIHPTLSNPIQSQSPYFVLSAGSVISHLALVHNWFESWRWTIDPPMWSVGAEWQIYGIFAICLLPMWRRFGPIATVAFAYTIGLVPMFLGYAFVNAWYLGLFAFGMFAAAINFRPDFLCKPGPPRRWEVGGIVLGSIAAALTAMKIPAHSPWPHPVLDTIVGLGTAMFLVGCTRRLQLGLPLGVIGRALEHRFSVRLGEFSYSFYLLHYPILLVLLLALAGLEWSRMSCFAVLTLVGVPAILVAAYGFHRLFERPFMLRVNGRLPEQSPKSAKSLSRIQDVTASATALGE